MHGKKLLVVESPSNVAQFLGDMTGATPAATPAAMKESAPAVTEDPFERAKRDAAEGKRFREGLQGWVESNHKEDGSLMPKPDILASANDERRNVAANKQVEKIKKGTTRSPLSHKEYETIRKIIHTDPHAESKRMFSEASAMERRGENATAMFFAADRRRMYELTHVKELSEHVQASRVLKRVQNSGGVPLPPRRPAGLGEASPVLLPSKPDILSGRDERMQPASTDAQKEAAANVARIQDPMRSMAEKQQDAIAAANVASMYDKDVSDVYSSKTAAERAKLGQPFTAHTMRNVAASLQGPEASRENSVFGSLPDRSVFTSSPPPPMPTSLPPKPILAQSNPYQFSMIPSPPIPNQHVGPTDTKQAGSAPSHRKGTSKHKTAKSLDHRAKHVAKTVKKPQPIHSDYVPMSYA